MSSIGLIIKQERLNQNLKQTVLAKGICSTSHLSKIENNATVPSDAVINSLLTRLNIEIEQMPNEEENKVICAFNELYKNSILIRDKVSIRKSLDQLSQKKITFFQLNNYYSYNLYLFRLLLVLDEEPDKLESSYQVMMKQEDNFDDKQKFIFHLNIGIYYYLNNDFQKALSKLESSLKFIQSASCEEWELADYYNVLSLTYIKCNDFFNSIHYASKSLEYYKDNLLFERAIDSYIVIGIAYKNLRKYVEAEKSYLLAKKLVTDYKLPHYNGIIFQNIGSLNAVQDRHEEAIRFYTDSLKSKEENKQTEVFLITILSFIKEYSKQGNQASVQHWCKEGWNRIDKSNIEKNPYYFHFKIYEALHVEKGQLEQVLKKGIHFFEMVHDDRHVQKYSILLADYYTKINKLRAADLYHQKSIQVLFKQKSITKWEDL